MRIAWALTHAFADSARPSAANHKPHIWKAACVRFVFTWHLLQPNETIFSHARWLRFCLFSCASIHLFLTSSLLPDASFSLVVSSTLSFPLSISMPLHFLCVSLHCHIFIFFCFWLGQILLIVRPLKERQEQRPRGRERANNKEKHAEKLTQSKGPQSTWWRTMTHEEWN